MSAANDADITPVDPFRASANRCRPPMPSGQSEQYYGSILFRPNFNTQVSSTSPPDRQELSTSWNGWIICSNDVLLVHFCSSLWHIFYLTISQHPPPASTTALLALIAGHLGSNNVLRPTLVAEEMRIRDHGHMCSLWWHRGRRNLWNSCTRWCRSAG